jgi:sulfur carrier protein ThiS
VPVTLIIRSQEQQVPAGISLREALALLGFSSETHMALREGEILPEDEVLKEGDMVRLIPVMSGG